MDSQDAPLARGPTASNLSSQARGDTKPAKKVIHRTQTGCRTCRQRRVECDEKKPVCSQCRKGKRNCEWSAPNEKRARTPRRPNATACDACREKKLKCIGDVRDPCRKCCSLGIECIRSKGRQDTIRPAEQPAASLPASDNSPSTLLTSLSHVSASDTDYLSPLPAQGHEPNGAASLTVRPKPSQLGELPTGKELDQLVQLYFSSDTFRLYTLHFNRLLAQGKAPRDLTLIMIASAMRFASAPLTPENLARADAWADVAIGSVLPRIHQGFGAIQLMTLLLAQHYDMNRGNFTSSWLMGAECTRMMQMMSLQTFDRTYSPSQLSNMGLSPLLSGEALRRVAWSTFYIDSIVDGGRYGFHVVDKNSYRLQLLCDYASFLSNETVKTEPRHFIVPG